MAQNVNKRKLWSLIIKDINYIIHYSHVFSVINILIDELVKELRNDKEIHIGNFGRFKLVDLKPKKIINIATGKIKFVKKTKALRFKISKKLIKLLFN
jgi:nucleoid DNA-binding protein